VYTLPKNGYEVELKIGRGGRVLAVIERWNQVGKIVERKRKLKKFSWLF